MYKSREAIYNDSIEREKDITYPSKELERTTQLYHPSELYSIIITMIDILFLPIIHEFVA